MAVTSIALQRLYQQRLSHNPLANPADVVAWMGAVQAQDYQGAKWALGLRMQNTTDDVIERAFTEGTILRTHVMRPTWHFVTPADIRWLLELTAPRVKSKLVYMDRQLELDKALLLQTNKLIVNAIQGGKQLTRAELGAVLVQDGIAIEGLRLGHMIMHAELDALVCSGARRGKQFTYALLDERAPQARVLKRDEALAELTRRYFTSHGPATVKDFVWWSGLSVAHAKAGIAMLGSDMTHDKIDNQTYCFSTSGQPAVEPCQAAFLLPTYDEFLVGFAGFDRSRKAGQAASKVGAYDSTLVIGGQVVGSWRRTFNKGAVIIELAPFAPLSDVHREAIYLAAQRYGQYLDMTVTLLPG